MNGTRWGLFLMATAGLFFVGPPKISAATTNHWTWGASGSWRAATNWSLLAAPGTNTSYVQINVGGGSKTVIVDTNGSATNLTINGLIVASLSSKSNWLVISNLTSANPFRILG